MRLKHFARAAVIALAGVACAGVAHAQGRTFQGEGADVAFGLGARALGMASTGAAFLDDPHAMFYNPALLGGFTAPMLAVSRQANARLRPVSYAGGTVPLTFLDAVGLRGSVGFAHFPRVHARSSGAFTAADPQSVFLRLLLPGVSGTFDGDIDSKTLVWRFSMGVQPLAHERLKLGFTVDRIDCKTNTCGVHAGSVGYETRTVHAVAFSFGAGISYDIGERVTVAASVADIDTTLKVTGTATDARGSVPIAFTAPLPRSTRFEVAWRPTDRLLLTGGYVRFAGTYGKSVFDVRTLNLGAEYAWPNGMRLRGGLWRPVKFQTGNLPLAIPIPVIPTLGAGWANDRLAADVAIYAHPLMTYHHGRVAPTAELSLSYRF